MKFNEINIELSEYSKKTIKLLHGKKNAKFQIPRLYIPFGMSGFTPPIGATKWNIDFNLQGWEEEGNPANVFYNWVRALEDEVKHKIADNAHEIFGTPKTFEQIDNMFNSNIKQSNNPIHPPKLRVKVDITPDGVIAPDIFDEQSNPLDDGEPSNGLFIQRTAAAIVELGGVYFMNKMIGITWKLVQMKLYEPSRLKGPHFVEEEEPKISGFQFVI
jgi:hypothetical protein